jgi:hypothetical protein
MNLNDFLKYSPANAKTETLKMIKALQKYLKNGRKIYSLDMLSGHSCPLAKDCLSKAREKTDGKRYIEDGKGISFRCFSASQEVMYNGVYNLRKHNFDLLRACKSSGAMLDLLSKSLPKNAGIIRIHVAGDFFSQDYFDAWLSLAALNPSILFYAYTKSIPYWLERKDVLKNLPNFVLTASRGGRKDNLIGRHKLRSVEVVFSKKEARAKGLQIDHDDSHAANPNRRKQSFALLIHNTQPKGSDAAKAKSKLDGEGSYSRKKRG